MLLGKLGPAAEAVLAAALLAEAGFAGAAGSTPPAVAYRQAMAARVRQIGWRLHLHQQLQLGEPACTMLPCPQRGVHRVAYGS